LIFLTGARFDDGAGGDNEVQRTMLELINQLDGFDPRGNIKVLIVALNTITPTPNLYNHVYLVYLVDSQQQTNAHTSKSGRPNSIL
jgi:hypothetical protein